MVEKGNKYKFIGDKFFLSLILLFFLSFSLYFFTWFVDDLYIYFRYVNNFVKGNGIVYNTGEYVEGFSSFVWFLILSVFGFLKMPLEISSKIISLVFAVLALLLMHRVSKELGLEKWKLFPVILTALNLPFILWSVSGFEISFYSFILLLCFYNVIKINNDKKNSYSLVFLLAAISFTRPEGFLFSLTFLIVLYFFSKDTRRVFFITVLGYFILLTGFLIFRYFYFGELLPNTYFAKLGCGIIGYNEIRIYRFGVVYILNFFFYNLHFAVLLFYLIFRIKYCIKEKNMNLLLSLIFVQFAFVIYAGGDWMEQFRFIVCVIPFISLLSAIVLKDLYERKLSGKTDEKVLYIIGILFLFVNLYFNNFNAIERERVLWNNVKNVNSELKSIIPQNSVVANGSAGVIPYYLENVSFIDIIGLTDKYIAKYGNRDDIWFEKYSTEYVYSKNPGWIILWKRKNEKDEYSTEKTSPAIKHIESDRRFTGYNLSKSYNVYEDLRIELFKKY